ncbi:DUF6274 family protein [Streptomyces anandii]|uniref:DUF6274 family protein n=1 Tax=Streptomyces anandii TaxID=285454 RepID=UPI0016790F58|nr:DUF6274 family protein [Streptomyces anandii]GGY11688.1 hypothetical protein GCM10010510_66990 [Streptomyces anandii JCM 4720]
MAASARHETRALLRAHLAAASSYRHLTRHCPVCRHLLRLAMDSPPRTAPTAPTAPTASTAPGTPDAPQEPATAPESPSTA